MPPKNLPPPNYRRPTPPLASSTHTDPGPESKIGPVSLDRNKASPPEASVSSGDNNRADLYTYFTKGPGAATETLYNGDRLWALVTLELQTAGPVVVGTRAQLTPVLSGRGISMATGKPITIRVAYGTRIYIASNAVSRVSVQIESVPWLEQISALLGRIVRLGGGK